MRTHIGEKIRVAAVFGPGAQIRPVWFEWRRRKHTVHGVTYRWRHHDGGFLHLHFSVSDGSTLYELAFNLGDQTWSLEEVVASPE